MTVADDVSLLDAASLALLGCLAAQGMIFLIATVRAGEPVPDLVTSLWRDGRLERVDLEDLSRAHLDTLLHLALGGPMEAGAGREFWEVTRGNPLYVRELVLGGLESGALVEWSGVWHLEGGLPSTTRLLDLVEQRIGGLSAEARSVVELLALCQPLDPGYLEAAVPCGVLESLERAGLVTTSRWRLPRSRTLTILSLARAADLGLPGLAGTGPDALDCLRRCRLSSPPEHLTPMVRKLGRATVPRRSRTAGAGNRAGCPAWPRTRVRPRSRRAEAGRRFPRGRGRAGPCGCSLL